MNKTNKPDEFVVENDRRARGSIFHRYRRQTDPSVWFPGVITVVIGALILWAVSALSDVEGLKLAQEKNIKWQEKHEIRLRMLEMAVSRLLPDKDMKGMYMATSGNK